MRGARALEDVNEHSEDKNIVDHGKDMNRRTDLREWTRARRGIPYERRCKPRRRRWNQ